jgi:hypothetical protein
MDGLHDNNDKIRKRNTTEFLKRIEYYEKYWSEQVVSTKDKLHGLSMSILSIIDGCDTENIKGFKIWSNKMGGHLENNLHEKYKADE